jgi:ubiquinone biosynthesis protein UbiJ
MGTATWGDGSDEVPSPGAAREGDRMATVDDCYDAVERLAGRFDQMDDASRRKVLDRTISCQLTDLDVTLTGHLHNGGIDDITTEPAPKAQIRLTMRSDDLVALADGQLDLMKAWTGGRVKVEASVWDLLRLRSAF